MSISPPIVVFDLDGTLVDTAPDLIDTLNVILLRDGFDPVPFDEARSMIGGGVKILLERGIMQQRGQISAGHVDRLYADYLVHYAEHIADRSRPFPGVIEALDALESRGFRFAVCTNKLESLSLRLLQSLELSQRFRAICGQDTFGIAKPDPDVLRRTILRAGGEVASAIMIGDSATDVSTARALGVPVIAVDFGYTDAPVHLLHPDRVISRFSDLPEAVVALTPRGPTPRNRENQSEPTG
jgi:phosphoglycolate phosphatase